MECDHGHFSCKYQIKYSVYKYYRQGLNKLCCVVAPIKLLRMANPKNVYQCIPDNQGGGGYFFWGGGVLKFYCIVSRKIRLGLIIEFTPSPKISMLGKLIIIDLHQLRHFIAVKIGIYLCVARYNFVHRTLLLLDIQVLYLHVHSESPVTYICLPYIFEFKA